MGGSLQPKSHIKYKMKKNFENIIIKLINVKIRHHFSYFVWFGLGRGPLIPYYSFCVKNKKNLITNNLSLLSLTYYHYLFLWYFRTFVRNSSCFSGDWLLNHCLLCSCNFFLSSGGSCLYFSFLFWLIAFLLA